MRIDSALLARIVAHAQRDFPNECCGMVGVRDQRAVMIHEATNVAASPLRFEVEGREIFSAQDAFEDEGAELAAIYHSHTRSEPYPSQTDINFAAGWPGVEWRPSSACRATASRRCAPTWTSTTASSREVEFDVEVAQ